MIGHLAQNRSEDSSDPTTAPLHCGQTGFSTMWVFLGRAPVLRSGYFEAVVVACGDPCLGSSNVSTSWALQLF